MWFLLVSTQDLVGVDGFSGELRVQGAVVCLYIYIYIYIYIHTNSQHIHASNVFSIIIVHG